MFSPRDPTTPKPVAAGHFLADTFNFSRKPPTPKFTLACLAVPFAMKGAEEIEKAFGFAIGLPLWSALAMVAVASFIRSREKASARP